MNNPAAKSVAHTPGPWTAGRNVILTRDETGPRRHIVEYCWPNDDAQMMADARLIAAAPELLEALKAIDANWTTYWPEGPDQATGDSIARVATIADETRVLWYAMRDAIEKAEGR